MWHFTSVARTASEAEGVRPSMRWTHGDSAADVLAPSNPRRMPPLQLCGVCAPQGLPCVGVPRGRGGGAAGRLGLFGDVSSLMDHHLGRAILAGRATIVVVRGAKHRRAYDR